MRLTDFKILTFDCYGTLIDWEQGMLKALKPLTDHADRPVNPREILEAHARHEAALQAESPTMPYSDLLAVVYRRIAVEWGVPVEEASCAAYGRSIADWPPFSDTVAALAYLKQHYTLVILSNIDNQSFAATEEKLGVEFDTVYTAEDIGAYKPSDENFHYMIEKLQSLGHRKADILHTAESLYHDHGPANRHGLKSCWIHRRYGQEGSGATLEPAAMPHIDFRFNSLEELVTAHRVKSGATSL